MSFLYLTWCTKNSLNTTYKHLFRITFLTIILLNSGLWCYAQQNTLYGIVSVHNSKFLNGKREYIANATVSDNFGRAQPVLTSTDGSFRLVYINIKAAESCEFEVEKEGMKVVNFTSLKAVIGQRDTIKISMSTQADLNRFRNDFYNTGKSETEKYLALQLLKKNSQLKLLQSDKTKNEGSIAQLQGELEALSKQAEQVDEQVRNIVGKYVNINLDDESPLVSNSVALFKQGQLDAALTLLNQLLNASKVEDIVSKRTDISTRKNEILKEEYQNNRESQDVGKAYLFKADIFKTQLQLDSVSFCYEQLMRLDSTDPTYLKAYGLYLEWINKYDDALTIYQKLLRVQEEKQKLQLLPNLSDKTYILNRIGAAYLNKHNYLLSESYFKQAFAIATQAFKKDSSSTEPLLADVYYSIGKLCRLTSNTKAAEENYNRAAMIYTRLGKMDPDLYGLALVKVQGSLGDLYNQTGNYHKSETLLLKALGYFGQQAVDSANEMVILQAKIFQLLGVSYSNLKEYSKAEEYFKKAIQRLEKLVSSNPVVYKPQLALQQMEIGNFYNELSNYPLAEAALLAAFHTYQDVSVNNEDIYAPRLAEVILKLGDTYRQRGELQKAEQYLTNAYLTYQKLLQKQPTAFLQWYALAKVYLGDLYQAYGKPKKAQLFYEEAQADYRKLVSQSANESNEVSLATTQMKLADSYDLANLPAQSALTYAKALSTYRKLVVLQPQTYEPDLAVTLLNLGDFYNRQKDTVRAAKVLEETLQLYRKLYRRNKQAYGINYGIAYLNTGDLLKIKRQFRDAEQTYEQALSLYKELAEQDSDTYQSWVALALDVLGSLYVERGDLTKAETALSKSFGLRMAAIRANPDISSTEAGKTGISLAKVIEVEKDAAIKEGAMFNSTVHLTVLYDTLNNLAKANSEILQELAAYYTIRANQLLKLARFEEAVAKAQQALQMQPDNLAAKIALAPALLYTGKYEEALVLYTVLKPLKDEKVKSVSTMCIAFLEQLKRIAPPNLNTDKILQFLKQ